MRNKKDYEYITKNQARTLLESFCYLDSLKKQALNILDSIEPLDVRSVVHGKWYDFNDCDYEWFCSECGYKSDSKLYSYCPSCGAMMNLGGIGMRKYTVVEYEESDFDELRDNMTNEEAASILDLLPRGYFPYSHPSYGDKVTERDYENYKICCALRLAMKALYDKGEK